VTEKYGSGLALVRQSLGRPYKVTLPMVILVGMVPFYIFIAGPHANRTQHVPAIAFDGVIPLVPAWSLVYGALYAFLIALPVFVVREEEHLRRTVRAYLAVWITAYACFLAYPTIAPRPEVIPEQGFGAWGLDLLYGMDPPYNCFPSLHVAHSFVSALTCLRVHRRVGIVAIGGAILVSLSTLFSKQHYVLDVIAGALMALVAYVVFIRPQSRAQVPELDRKVAPVFAWAILACSLLGLAGYWVAYRIMS
jgi:membrane-associated phospholipid phosphatase